MSPFYELGDSHLFNRISNNKIYINDINSNPNKAKEAHAENQRIMSSREYPHASYHLATIGTGPLIEGEEFFKRFSKYDEQKEYVFKRAFAIFRNREAISDLNNILATSKKSINRI